MEVDAINVTQKFTILRDTAILWQNATKNTRTSDLGGTAASNNVIVLNTYVYAVI
jgi:hypothetical protein